MAPKDKSDKPPGGKRTRPSRIVIYPKDIQLLTGKSYRHALDLNKEIRDFFKKEKQHLLTIYEFAQYTGVNPEIILIHLK
ncbi:hypothetical protein QRD02_13495 [Aequorivita sp. SDUM287046]|uniref:Uncharacterized protein n=1 Tax=Aequorivita aurantiaca TaxID=3053356 RepID=A0ABT8DKF9_9FLAO|nr:hypothetical protein [Aequorivita aurantiaca]MDN3725397.1 hypothetical protein [Aequorivita aurantiaca]